MSNIGVLDNFMYDFLNYFFIFFTFSLNIYLSFWQRTAAKTVTAPTIESSIRYFIIKPKYIYIQIKFVT